MYVCAYVCMYVCIYVCMYVCACLSVCLAGWLSICLSVCLYVCLFVCLYVMQSPTHYRDPVCPQCVCAAGGNFLMDIRTCSWATAKHLLALGARDVSGRDSLGDNSYVIDRPLRA